MTDTQHKLDEEMFDLLLNSDLHGLTKTMLRFLYSNSPMWLSADQIAHELYGQRQPASWRGNVSAFARIIRREIKSSGASLVLESRNVRRTGGEAGYEGGYRLLLKGAK